jgi:hypothetical protein
MEHMKWRRFDSPSPLMKNHTSTFFNSHIYVFGGFDGSSNNDKLYKMNVESGEWSEKETINTISGRNGHTQCLVDNNRVFYIGGWLGMGPLGSEEVHVLDLIKFQWSVVQTTGNHPGSCNMASANYVSELNSIFLFRGG